jgi:hypothetical protein
VADWLACETCSELIEAGDLAGLTARAAQVYVEYHELSSTNAADLIADGLEDWHRGFWENRAGDRVPLTMSSPNREGEQHE